MTRWTDRVVIGAARNGTLTHTVDPSSATGVVSGSAFTPTAGSLLVVVCEGAVTSTTPTGWTLPTGGSAVNNTGLYVWWRTAAGADTFTTTHNGADYAVAFSVYQFAAGSVFLSAVASSGVAKTNANPNLTGLTSSPKLLFATKAMTGANTETITGAWSGSPAPTEDVDTAVLDSATGGYWFGVAYSEDAVATSWAPTCVVSLGPSTTCEAITFAVTAAAAGVAASTVSPFVSRAAVVRSSSW